MRRAGRTAARPAPFPTAAASPTSAAQPARQAQPPAAHRAQRTATRATTRTRVSTPVALPAGGSATAVVAAALARVGTPYVYGAAGAGGVDCSGLVVVAYAAIGVHLPHYTGALLGQGRAVARGDLQPGDLVFPTSAHVAIYVGGGMMVAAPRPGDVVKVQSVYAFYAARRIL